MYYGNYVENRGEKNETMKSNNMNAFFNMFDHNIFDNNENQIPLKKTLDENVDTKERMMIYHIPEPASNQKPSKMKLTRIECCKLVGISIYEYLFIYNDICGLKPIFMSNGKLFFKVYTVIAIITSAEIWLLSSTEYNSKGIVNKLLHLFGYSINTEIDTPSTNVSFCDSNGEETISHCCSSRNSSIMKHSPYFEHRIHMNNLSIGFTPDKNKNSVQHYSDKNQIEYSPEIRNKSKNSLNTIKLENKCYSSLSFIGICIDIILETMYLDLVDTINTTKNEAINCCNSLIKSSKWYKYPWRFTFTDFTRKKIILKSVNVIELNISVLNESLTRLMEEMKISQNENEYFTIIPIEEWEKILNKYIPIMYKLSKELTEIKTSINFSDELSKVYLDFQRNEYMYTNLKISLLALSCSLTSVITGIFGMNLLSGMERDPIAWYIVTFAIVLPIILWGISSWFTGILCKREIHNLGQSQN